MNEDYANFFLVADVCFTSYTETMVNEISILPRNAIVTIDVEKKNMSIEYNDYQEKTIDVDSAEAMSILDDWYERWITTIYNAKSEGSDIIADLSGGFDSRMSFMLVLESGIPLEDIYIHSIDDGLHTHKEDYEIALEISKYFGFELNNTNSQSKSHTKYSLDEQIAASFYTKLGIYKQMYYKPTLRSNRRYMIGGAGGECIRGYWNYTYNEFLEKQYGRCGWLPVEYQNKVKKSIERLLSSARNKLSNKYGIEIDDNNSRELVDFFFEDIYCRNHFGKDAVENYMSNTIRLNPLLDPQLHRIKTRNHGCIDSKLLMAVIFKRFKGELINFRFEGGRNITDTTLSYAQCINDKYPTKEVKLITSIHQHCNYDAKSTFEHRNYVKAKDIEKYICRCFSSQRVRYVFNMEGYSEAYDFAVRDYGNREYQPLSSIYVILSIYVVITACWQSRDKENVCELLDGLANSETVYTDNMEIEVKRAESQIFYKTQYESVIKSPSFKIGRAITYLPRKIRDILKGN